MTTKTNPIPKAVRKVLGPGKTSAERGCWWFDFHGMTAEEATQRLTEAGILHDPPCLYHGYKRSGFVPVAYMGDQHTANLRKLGYREVTKAGQRTYVRKAA
jgi:hypothetical protein